MKKNILLFTLLIFVSFTGMSYANDIKVSINGKLQNFDSPPVSVQGRTMVPLRHIFEALGAELEWQGDTQTIIGSKDGKEIQLIVGQKFAILDGARKDLDVPAMLINNRTMVPTRFIAESLGANVNWDADSKTVQVSADGYQVVTQPSVIQNPSGKYVNGKDANHIPMIIKNGFITEIELKPFLEVLGFTEHRWIADAQALFSTRPSDGMRTNFKVGQKDVGTNIKRFIVIDNAPIMKNNKMYINQEIIEKVFDADIIIKNNSVNIITNTENKGIEASINFSNNGNIISSQSASELNGLTTNVERILKAQDGIDELKNEVNTIGDLLLLYSSLNFKSRSGDTHINDDNMTWSYNIYPELSLELRKVNCGAVSNFSRLMLEDSFDEEGFIHYLADRGGHVVNYFKVGEYYYIIDFTQYIMDKKTAVFKTKDLGQYAERILIKEKDTRFIGLFNINEDYISGYKFNIEPSKKLTDIYFPQEYLEGFIELYREENLSIDFIERLSIEKEKINWKKN